MSSNSNRKKLVKRRMADAGETYEVARKWVDDDIARQSAELFESIKRGVEERRAAKCVINVYSLRSPPSEALLALAAEHSFEFSEEVAGGMAFRGPLAKADGFCDELRAKGVFYEQMWESK